MNKFNYTNLTPFKWFVLENFPFIEADFDALTEWQLFCKLGKEMNKIIDSQNIVGEQAEALTSAFIALKNYVDNFFDNLDVQEEINNKLNQMAEDGTLANIMQTYLNNYNMKTFVTVENMIEDVSLQNGNKTQTLGYYNFNDFGASKYVITNENLIANGSDIIELNNGLFAKLIKSDVINARQFGCKGNGIYDDTQYLKNLLNYCFNNDIFIINGNNLDYKITEKLNITNKININNFNIIADFQALTNNGEGILELEGENININNCNIDGKNYNHVAILLKGCKKVNINNCNFNNCYYTAIKCSNSPSNITIKNCVADRCTNYFLGGAFQIDENASNVIVENCEVKNIVGKGFVAIDCKNVDFIKCKAVNCVYENFSPRRNAEYIRFIQCYSLKDTTSNLTDPNNPLVTPISNSGVKCSRGAKNVIFELCELIQRGGTNVVSAIHLQGILYCTINKCKITSESDQCILCSWHPDDGELYPAISADHIRITNNELISAGKRCILLNPGGGQGVGNTLTDYVIENNTFENYNSGIRALQVTDLTIKNNIFKESTVLNQACISIEGTANTQDYSYNTLIENNTFMKMINYAIRSFYSKNLKVKNNLINGNLNTQFLLQIDNTIGGIIDSNIFNGIFNTGITLNANSNNFNIINNIFDGNGTGTGIRQNGSKMIIGNNNFNVISPINPVNGNLVPINGNSYIPVCLGTEPPTSGTWAKGAKVYNINPDPAEYIGWVCVSAGSPRYLGWFWTNSNSIIKERFNLSFYFVSR